MLSLTHFLKDVLTISKNTMSAEKIMIIFVNVREMRGVATLQDDLGSIDDNKWKAG